jgi:hypothetical protein
MSVLDGPNGKLTNATGHAQRACPSELRAAEMADAGIPIVQLAFNLTVTFCIGSGGDELSE